MILHPPTLETERLILRPFEISDAKHVQTLAGDPLIYATTLHVPHPYDDGIAEKWIASHAASFYNDKIVSLAITLKATDELVGTMALVLNLPHQNGAITYWVGVPYWNCGYCTEAANAMIQYGFEVRCLHKITACHFEKNTASGRVMEKGGMMKEAVCVDEILKDGKFHTLIHYGIINNVS